MTKTLAVALSFLTFAAPTALAASFSDVPSTNPYYPAIESMKNLGVVKGYTDGTFKPDQPVNRAEALKMVLVAGGQKVTPGLYMTGFPDVKLSDWFSGYVFTGQNLQIVKGNPDGTFAPARQVNKAEFLKMSEESFQTDLTSYKTVQGTLAHDVTNVSDWFVPYLNYAKSMGIIYPTLDNNLEPGNFLTRAQCAEILYKMFIIKNGGSTQELLSIAEAKLVDAVVQINNNNLADALTRAQEAVFYTGKALQQEPNSSVTQGANLIAQGFQNLFEAYAAGATGTQNNPAQLKTLAEEAKSDADQAVAKDSSLQTIAQQLKTLADNLMQKAGV